MLYGIYLQKNESNATQVTLTNVYLNATGEYSCEVSADAPSFHTAIVYATMNVAGKQTLKKILRKILKQIGKTRENNLWEKKSYLDLVKRYIVARGSYYCCGKGIYRDMFVRWVNETRTLSKKGTVYNT